MAHEFFRQKQDKKEKDDNTDTAIFEKKPRTIFMSVDDMDFNDKTEGKEEEVQVPNTVKGLQEVSLGLGLGSNPILVPQKRTQSDEIEIILKKISVTMDQMLKRIEDIEKAILFIESNNNISDSDTKKFIELTINKYLEQFKNFITTNYFKDLKDEKIENLGHNDMIIIVGNAPSKQMLKINSDTANDIINNILEKGGKCYITDNMNKKTLSQQIEEIKQAEILERKEDPNSRMQRLNIEPKPDKFAINFASDEEGDKEEENKEIEEMLEKLNKK